MDAFDAFTTLLSLSIHPQHEEIRPVKNITMTVSGTILTIAVDLSKTYGPSSSGKNIVIASTEGNVSIPDREEKIGLNIYVKK